MMNPETLDGAIRALSGRVPFHPYTLVMDDGGRLEVDHPKVLAYRDGTGLFVAPGGIPHLFNAEGVNRVIGDLAGVEGVDAQNP